jgi:serine/threonine-protein kinase
MPIVCVADLVQSLTQNEILEPEQLQEVVLTLQARYTEPRDLARDLLQRNWLTPYQINQIFQDRGAELVLGDYLLLERLGEGGMGQVFKARGRQEGRVVALKLIRKEQTSNRDTISRFHREIHIACQMSHPNIVGAIDDVEVGGTRFFVMEYVEGSDLGKRVKKQGPLPVIEVCHYLRQAALGLAHSSQLGLVHRDIKPSNLLLTYPPESKSTGIGLVKILDMGLARADAGDEEVLKTLTVAGTVMGTPDFMAPEQALDPHNVDVRGDLYSLGCTGYYLLTGRVPFPGGSLVQKLERHRTAEPRPLQELRPDIPAAVAAIIHKLMAKHPRDRYQTPEDLVKALNVVLGIREQPPSRLPVPPSPTPHSSPNAQMLEPFGQMWQPRTSPQTLWIYRVLVVCLMVGLVALIIVLLVLLGTTPAKGSPPPGRRAPGVIRISSFADKETGRQGDKETRNDSSSSVSLSPCFLISLSPKERRSHS